MIKRGTGSFMGVTAKWTTRQIESDDQPTRCNGTIRVGGSEIYFCPFLKWWAFQRWPWDEARLLFKRMGVPLRDRTFTEQLSAGDRVRRGGKSHHGEVPQFPRKDTDILLNARRALSSSHDAANRVQRKTEATNSTDPKTPPSSPEASDLAKPAPRQECKTYRILRDTRLARWVKALHKNKCQICNHAIILPDGTCYSEAHHIQPLGKPHDGHDVIGNIICVCPNHHAELDYGVRRLTAKGLRAVAGHSVNESYIRYHNDRIYRRGAEPAG